MKRELDYYTSPLSLDQDAVRAYSVCLISLGNCRPGAGFASPGPPTGLNCFTTFGPFAIQEGGLNTAESVPARSARVYLFSRPGEIFGK